MTQEKTQEKNGSPRMGLLIAAAATALTVAAGLTAGSLLGYVGPARGDAASRSGEVAATEVAVTAGAGAAEGTPAGAAQEPARGEPPPASAGVEEGTSGGRGERGEHEGRERAGHHHGEREHGEHERGDDGDD